MGILSWGDVGLLSGEDLHTQCVLQYVLQCVLRCALQDHLELTPAPPCPLVCVSLGGELVLDDLARHTLRHCNIY